MISVRKTTAEVQSDYRGAAQPKYAAGDFAAMDDLSLVYIKDVRWSEGAGAFEYFCTDGLGAWEWRQLP